MEAGSKLRPGENGTRTLLKQYGKQLILVRQRYDRLRRKRYKTVALIMDEKDRIQDALCHQAGTCISESILAIGNFGNRSGGRLPEPGQEGLAPGIPEGNRTGAGTADHRPGNSFIVGRCANKVSIPANYKYSIGN